MFPNNAIFLVELIVILIFTPLNGESSEPNLRIVGGTFSKEGVLPFQVSLQKQNQHFCGGSILNNCWVLTAAHCFDGMNAYDIPNMSVVAGTTKLWTGYGVKVKVEKYIYHKEYKHLIDKINLNDIALVKLQSCFTYSNTIQPVKLLNDKIGGGVHGIISGWGRTDQDNTQSTNDLKILPVTTVTNQQCKETFPYIEDGNICVFNATGQGACFGDSGGPLTIPGTNLQIGLTSYGILCARGVPDSYTRISSYIQWIKNNAI